MSRNRAAGSSVVVTRFRRYSAAMTMPIDETGTLLREGGAFVLRRDAGGVSQLRLARVPVDHVGKRVRILGSAADDGIIDVDGVAGA